MIPLTMGYSHCCPIQDYDAEFYRGKVDHMIPYSIVVITAFHIVVCGLDSVVARRWMNGMLVSEDIVIDHMIHGDRSHDPGQPTGIQ